MPYNTVEKRKTYYTGWCQRNKQRQREYGRTDKRKLKTEVLTYYGGGKLACVHCGFEDIRALSIDHIEGGGTHERRGLNCRRGGSDFYRWLRRQGYPKGYQTLCMNCQFIKRFERKEWLV